MKKTTTFGLLLFVTGLLAWGQTSISQDVTVLGSYGLGEASQALQNGTDVDKKNGYSLNANLTFTSKVAYFYDIVVKLNAKSRVGSPYQELQLAYASVQTLGVTVDSAYGRLNVLNVLGLADPFDFYLTAGKYQPQAANLQKVSLYGTESALNMLKLANTLNTGLELTYKLPVEELVPGAAVPLVSFQAATALNFDEGTAKLYDTDGLLADHGEAVSGKYVLPLYTSLKLTNYRLPFGSVSAEGVYTLSGAGSYTGNCFGVSALVNTEVVPETWTVPVGLGVAYYEKNVDTLAGNINTSSTETYDKPLGFRGTLRAGLATGLHYLVPQEFAADLNVAGTYTQVKHIYRDPLSLIGLSLDTKVTWAGTYFVGAGALLGTLTDATWKTSSGVLSSADDTLITFKPAENFGAEAYCGLNFGTKGSLVLGVNNNKGLAMNYGLESLKDGEYKFLQKNSSAGLYETLALYLKASFKL